MVSSFLVVINKGFSTNSSNVTKDYYFNFEHFEASFVGIFDLNFFNYYIVATLNSTKILNCFFDFTTNFVSSNFIGTLDLAIIIS